MQNYVVSQLLKAAQSSTMSSRHAAAITCGKRLLTVDTNCSLPAGELVDIAATAVASQCATQCQPRGHSSNTFGQCNHKQTPFNQLYERYQGFEEDCVRRQSSIYQQSIDETRCEKHSQAFETSKAYWPSISAACRGECLGSL